MVSCGSNLYYNTDHHWNTHGAYFAYTQICNRMGIVPYQKEYFSQIIASENFRGTSYTRSGLPTTLVNEDTVTIYRYDNDERFIVEYHENEEIRQGFYDNTALESIDKYSVFLGGNYPYLSISDSKNADKEKLLLIKDSFANSVIPFLALHFDIEVIDPRYCNRTFLTEQLERTDIDKTLILVGFETLKQDFLIS